MATRMATVQEVVATISFAVPQMDSMADALRYAATIHQDATRKEFIAACVLSGYKANTAGNRFHESRKFDKVEHGNQYAKNGSLAIKGENF